MLRQRKIQFIYSIAKYWIFKYRYRVSNATTSRRRTDKRTVEPRSDRITLRLPDLKAGLTMVSRSHRRVPARPGSIVGSENARRLFRPYIFVAERVIHCDGNEWRCALSGGRGARAGALRSANLG
ncbi:hypothetical protein EVAR_74079_1 [Eumeta japonica]|uniref:Uncharacterized protein n=1 Tax=Eumeta variegata TaxID=151549 RepID=A0A4C1TCH6_EUMVA|nr:hypothetical protein EVAR_74079_1 [Eumeta japonica]